MNTLTKTTTRFILPNTRRTLTISLFSTTSTPSPPSSNQPTPSPYHQQGHIHHHSSRRQEEESRNVRVSVWWDIENCGVPTGVNVFKIAPCITAAVRANGIKGPLQITAFGDILCLARANQEALSSTGVNLIHIPNGGKNSADRSLLVDLMYWVSQNPPPAHVFLISSDRDFAGILHKLRMSNYNILLAAREGKQTSGVLCSAASVMWHWNELAKGVNLSGRHFNQPPDGPFNSWYGHYRGPLEDPFDVSEQQSCSEAEDSSNGEPKHRPIPIAVLRQLRRIVNSHPEGLNITELRAQLEKNKVAIDKNVYGYKKFSRFLMAIPRIVKVDSRPDGQFFLRPASPLVSKPVESGEFSAGSMAVNGNRDAQVTAKANGETPTITRMVDVKPLLPMSHSVDGKEETVEETIEKHPLGASRENEVVTSRDMNGIDASDAKLDEDQMKHTEEKNSEHGLFRSLWTKIFSRSVDAENTNDESPDRIKESSPDPVKSESEKELDKTSVQMNADGPAHSSSSIVSNLEANSDNSNKSEINPGLIAKILNWCKFWRNESSVDRPNEVSVEGPSPVEEESRKSDDASHIRKMDDDAAHLKKMGDDASDLKQLELFAKDAFWNALRSFLKTHRGSDIVVNSTSREQFAESLQKGGPLVLRPLQISDMHHLVDLLISEKKWIQEFPSKKPRFALVHLSEVTFASPKPHSSTGLSSIFLSSTSRENPESRVSSIVHKKPSEKTRSETLVDCQKLLDEILPQYPDGFNFSLFKKLFLEKYGYALDHQKLGYPKLVSLLQVMPGVKIEASHVYPDRVTFAPGIDSLGIKEKSTSSDSDWSDSPQKEDVESQWEELGPVAKSNPDTQGLESSPGRNGDYEPSLSDDDFSDAEEERPSSSQMKAEEPNKSNVNEEDSSLLQILDSWNSTKDENNPRAPPSNPEGLTDCSDEEIRPSGSVKHKPQKSYKFVAEPIETKKDKLIDGILGSLKKSGESRMHG